MELQNSSLLVDGLGIRGNGIVVEIERDSHSDLMSTNSGRNLFNAQPLPLIHNFMGRNKNDGMIEIIITQDETFKHNVKYERDCDSIFPHTKQQNKYINGEIVEDEAATDAYDHSNFGPSLSCVICNQQFASKEILDEHCRIHNKPKKFTWPIYKNSTHKDVVHEKSKDNNTMSIDENCFMCFLCEDCFDMKEDLDNHMQDHIEKANDINANLSNKQDFTVEKIRLFTENAFTCLICEEPFGSKQILNKHIEIHNSARKNICHICAKPFDSRGNLIKHIKTHTDDRPYTCFACGKSFKLNHHLTNHMRIHTGEKPFKCEQCGKTFNENGSLKRHYRSHGELRPYECSLCGISFKQPHHLTDHLRSHTGHKPYKCSICGKGLSTSNSLQKHYRIHTGEKPHRCPICNKQFSDKSTLRRHVIAHGKVYTCKICGETFKEKRILILHQRNGDCEKPFQCPVCDKRFNEEISLDRHKLLHNKKSTLQCELCPRNFLQKASLERHILQQHVKQEVNED